MKVESTGSQETKKSKLVTLLDPKRGQNAAIALARLKLTTIEVKKK
jgi:hypothetical protein